MCVCVSVYVHACVQFVDAAWLCFVCFLFNTFNMIVLLPPLQTETEENPVSQEGVPPGFEAISLVEALNGQVVPQNGQTDGQ